MSTYKKVGDDSEVLDDVLDAVYHRWHSIDEAVNPHWGVPVEFAVKAPGNPPRIVRGQMSQVHGFLFDDSTPMLPNEKVLMWRNRKDE